MANIVKERFTLPQICRMAQVSRTQLNQWISRGYFKPEEEFDHGRRRTFSFKEACHLLVFTDLMRQGLTQETASRHTANLHTFKDEPAILIAQRGPIHLIKTSKRGEPATTEKGLLSFDPNQEPIHLKIIKLSELPDHFDNPLVYSATIINLKNVEARAIQLLEKILADDEAANDGE